MLFRSNNDDYDDGNLITDDGLSKEDFEFNDSLATEEQKLICRELSNLSLILKERNRQLQQKEESIRKRERRLQISQDNIEAETEKRVMDRFEQFKAKWERAHQQEIQSQQFKVREIVAENKRLQHSSRELILANRKLREQIVSLRTELENRDRERETFQHQLRTARERSDRLKTIMITRQALEHSVKDSLPIATTIMEKLSPQSISIPKLPLPTICETTDVYTQTVNDNFGQHRLCDLMRISLELASRQLHPEDILLCLEFANDNSGKMQHSSSKLLSEIYFRILLNCIVKAHESMKTSVLCHRIGQNIFETLRGYHGVDKDDVLLLLVSMECLKNSESLIIIDLLRMTEKLLENSSEAPIKFLNFGGLAFVLQLILEPFDDLFSKVAAGVFVVIEKLHSRMDSYLMERLCELDELFSKVCLRMFGVYDLGSEQEKTELKPQMIELAKFCRKFGVDEALSAWLRGNSFWPEDSTLWLANELGQADESKSWFKESRQSTNQF